MKIFLIFFSYSLKNVVKLSKVLSEIIFSLITCIYLCYISYCKNVCFLKAALKKLMILTRATATRIICSSVFDHFVKLALKGLNVNVVLQKGYLMCLWVSIEKPIQKLIICWFYFFAFVLFYHIILTDKVCHYLSQQILLNL